MCATLASCSRCARRSRRRRTSGAAAALLGLLVAPTAVAESRARISLPNGADQPSMRLELRAKKLSYRPMHSAACVKGRCPAHISLRGAVRIDARCTRRPATSRPASSSSSRARAARGSARCQPFSVHARSVSITVDARGQARVVEARGAVTLRAGTRHGRAQRLTMLPRQRRLELSGDATLDATLDDSKLGARLSGARIVLDLRSGAVEVQRARASFGGSAERPSAARRAR